MLTPAYRILKRIRSDLAVFLPTRLSIPMSGVVVQLPGLFWRQGLPRLSKQRKAFFFVSQCRVQRREIVRTLDNNEVERHCPARGIAEFLCMAMIGDTIGAKVRSPTE